MFKKFTFYLFPIILLFQATLTTNQIPNREAIILLETLNEENLGITLNANNRYVSLKELHPKGIGAMTVTMLIALYQQAAPIIANKSLIKNVIDHQNLHTDFVKLDRNSLYNKYSRFNKFKGRLSLDNFRENYQYLNRTTNEVNKILGQQIKNDTKEHVYQILNKIETDKRFNIQHLPQNISNLIKDIPATNSLCLEMVIYTLCSWIDFQNWEIKQVNEDIFLMIPNNYIQDLHLKNTVSNISASITPSKLTNLELELGLKIDHMKKVNRNFFEQPIQKNTLEVPFVKSLEQIFITNDDIKKANPDKVTKHIWSLYFAGHGLPKCAPIAILPQMEELKNLSKKRLRSPKFKECLTYEKNRREAQLSGLTNIDNHIYQCKHHASCKQEMDKIKKIDREIQKIKSGAFCLDKTSQGVIASLSVDEFRDVLKFFNHALETTFLYYTSCFAGGVHLLEPYTEAPGSNKPLILNYSVISGTPAENMSLQEFPAINLPPYSKTGITQQFEPSQIHIQDIDIPNKRLKLNTTLQFKRFFGALRKGIHNDRKSLIMASYSLHPHIDSTGKIMDDSIANIPLVRFANTDHFETIPGDNSSTILDAKNSSKPLTIDKQSALIYTDHISGKISLNKLGEYQNIPKLFSMLPGFACHTFEEISSSTLSLKEVVNAFLTFPELGSSKIFWIKKLECAHSGISNLRTKTFKDVIIMRNVFNSNSLARCTNNNLAPLENCAYLSDTSKESKLTWNGPFLEDNNYKINICGKSEHKEECINSFPTITSFLSPVLQSI